MGYVDIVPPEMRARHNELHARWDAALCTEPAPLDELATIHNEIADSYHELASCFWPDDELVFTALMAQVDKHRASARDFQRSAELWRTAQ